MTDHRMSKNIEAASTYGNINHNLEQRYRPKNLPFPEILSRIDQHEGYIATDYWTSEDGIFIHPPNERAICIVLRAVNLGKISSVSAAVMAPKQHGPALSMSIGIAPAGIAKAENWENFMGRHYQIFPSCWGIVQVNNNNTDDKNCYDILLSAQVIGRQGNENAWAIFRRFSFAK